MNTSALFNQSSRPHARQDGLQWSGSSWPFMLAIVMLAIWAVSGPLFDYSNTWQLLVNTATSIVTFLMVLLIQDTQHRDAEATQQKLDELLRVIKGARSNLGDIEVLSDDELSHLKEEFARMGNQPDDLVRLRLRHLLGRGRSPVAQEQPGGPAGTTPARAPLGSNLVTQLHRQKQVGEFPLPVQKQQQQWT